MKKIISGTLTIFITVLSVFSQDIKLNNRLDSVSYAVGVSMFEGAKQFRLKLNYEQVVAAFMDASEEDALMTVESANDYINRVHRQVQDAELRKTKEIGTKFMEENAKVDGMITTQSGLQYRVIEKGSGQPPTAEDRVKVHYKGYLLDGTVFDSSYDRGDVAVFSVKSVIPGWIEVLQLMPVGSEYVVYIPPTLAYGDRQMGDDIKPGSTLIFEIKLLEIVK